MKVFVCKFCRGKKDRFSGTRREVRLHLREEHFVRGLAREYDDPRGKRLNSQLTANTIIELCE